MASGRAHALASLTLTAGMLWAGPALPPHLLTAEQAAFGALGAMSGIILSPDLDVRRRTYAENVFGRLWWLWALIWWPYAYRIRHRHWLSHGPIVGTLGRLAYLLVPAWLLLSVLGQGGLILMLVGDGRFHHFVGGLMLSDALHWLMDR